MKTKLYTLSLIAVIFFVQSSRAAIDTIRNGSYIINMGVVPQTINNGLKPYGLVYDLLKNHKVPVRWMINSTKVKDGIDFSNNGINYRGGTFIIPVEFRNATINSVISGWESQGVIGATSVGEFTISDFQILHFAPEWTLDKTNGSIAAAYFVNAGIPASAHGGASNTGWKNPSELGECDDIFVMPHADPTWLSHINLVDWNKNYKGNIWAACHAVSVLEDLNSSGVQMNFLSTTGLVNYLLHSAGSPPYTYNYPSDPVMQFMGSLDGATTMGSEQIFLPKLGGGWNTGAKVGVHDPDQADMPLLSPGPAAVIVYGRGFDDPNRGWVMYEGGHDHNKSNLPVPARVAAQRAFFNFSFFSSSGKTAWFDITMNGINQTIVPGATIPLSFSVPAAVNLSKYTIQWSSTAGGVFSSNANQQSVNYTPPASLATNDYAVITVTLTDLCGRTAFSSRGTYVASILASSDIKLSGNFSEAKSEANLNWHVPTTDGIVGFQVEKSTVNNSFSVIGAITAQENKKGFNYIDNIFQQQQKTFYRIKAIYANGTFKYSNVIGFGAGFAFQHSLTVVSNPVRNGALLLDYKSENDIKAELLIIDAMGRKVLQKNNSVNKGVTRLSTDISGLSTGTYFVQVRTEQSMMVEKFIVIRY